MLGCVSKVVPLLLLPPAAAAWLQERDDMRKRARQERLHELRTGARQSWVQLNRRLPAVDAF
jgi:hypothetical protein